MYEQMMKAQENDGDTFMNKKNVINQVILSAREENMKRILIERVLQKPDITFFLKVLETVVLGLQS